MIIIITTIRIMTIINHINIVKNTKIQHNLWQFVSYIYIYIIYMLYVYM